MRTILANATQVQRDKLDAVAVEFSAGQALSMALRWGYLPSRADVERWCPTWCQRRAGSSARLDSSRLAHESMVIGKYENLVGQRWLEQREPGEDEAERARKLQAERERERYVDARAAQLEQSEAESRIATRRAQAELEYSRGRRGAA